MTVSRRATTAGLAASLAAALLPEITAPAVEAAEVHQDWWPHPLFASTRLAGATWRDITPPMDAEDYAAVTPEVQAGMRAAILHEAVVNAEVGWLDEVRKVVGKPSKLYWPPSDWAKGEKDHETLGATLLRAAPLSANTAIVSPLMLTILQGGRSNFAGIPGGSDLTGSSLRYFGKLENLKVFVNLYLTDNEPALVGHVPAKLEKRRVALQRVGLSNVEIGTLPDHINRRDWALVGIEPSNLMMM